MEYAGFMPNFFPEFTVFFLFSFFFFHLRRLMSWPSLITPIIWPSSFTFSPRTTTFILHFIIYYQETAQQDINTMPEPSEKHSAFNNSCGQTCFTVEHTKNLEYHEVYLPFLFWMCPSVFWLQRQSCMSGYLTAEVAPLKFPRPHFDAGTTS